MLLRNVDEYEAVRHARQQRQPAVRLDQLLGLSLQLSFGFDQFPLGPLAREEQAADVSRRYGKKPLLFTAIGIHPRPPNPWRSRFPACARRLQAEPGRAASSPKSSA